MGKKVAEVVAIPGKLELVAGGATSPAVEVVAIPGKLKLVAGGATSPSVDARRHIVAVATGVLLARPTPPTDTSLSCSVKP